VPDKPGVPRLEGVIVRVPAGDVRGPANDADRDRDLDASYDLGGHRSRGPRAGD